jgi:riboflavin kinase/FMN adenylyltransferase
MSTQLAREELARARPPGPSAVTIGKFDGVHRGHRYLVEHLLDRARAEGLATVVMTLHPHPATVLRPGTHITYLCSLEERVTLLRQLGVDRVGVLSFTSELAELSYREFMRLLVDELRLRLLLTGPDFAVGRDRAGTFEALSALGEEWGFRVESVPLLTEGSEKVGSGAVREALAEGEMELVTELLGRPFSLRGPVIRGAERGRTLGFPTANIAVAPDLAIPRFGVYATRAFVGEARYDAVTNIGQRPTFDETRPTIEAYLLDFEGDLYERELRLEVLHRLRDEARFSGPDELVEQIRRDVAAAREYLAKTT